MKHMSYKSLIMLAAVATIAVGGIFSVTEAASGYRHKIRNMTNYPQKVKTNYESPTCSNDTFWLDPGKDHTVKAGICILNSIKSDAYKEEAVFATDVQGRQYTKGFTKTKIASAKPYKGPYTGSTTFLITGTEESGFIVTHEVN